MADFVHLRRVYVSQRLTRGRRDFHTAALDFRAQQHLLSKARVLDPDYAVKVLNPEEDRESEKRVPGGFVKPPEVRFDPKGVRQPGQILKLHVTAKDMLDESEKPNFGWVDPPTPVSMEDDMNRLAERPTIHVREFDINPRTGRQNEDSFQDFEVKSLGDKIGGAGRSLMGRAARKLGLIVDDLGKFRCPPGTPNANQFTDITGSTCYPSLGRVRGAINYLLDSHLDLGNPYAHVGVPRDVADRIGGGWSGFEAQEAAGLSVAEQMRWGRISSVLSGISTPAEMKEFMLQKDGRVGRFVKGLGIDIPDNFDDPESMEALNVAFVAAIEKAIEDGLWTNGKDVNGRDRPKPVFSRETLFGSEDMRGMTDEERETARTRDLVATVMHLERGGKITKHIEKDELDQRVARYEAQKSDVDKRGDGTYEAVEKFRKQWVTAENAAMIAFLDLVEQKHPDVNTIAEFVLGSEGMGTGELTGFVSKHANPGGRLEGADPMHSTLLINMRDATVKQYWKFKGNKISQVIARGDKAEGDKWNRLLEFFKDQQRIGPFLKAWPGPGGVEETGTAAALRRWSEDWHGQEAAGAMFQARRAETMHVTYHGFTHVGQHRIFRERVEAKLDADGVYTIHPPSLYDPKRGGTATTYGDEWEAEPIKLSYLPLEEHLLDKELPGAEDGIPMSHWTNGQLSSAVISEMLDESAVTDDFPPGDMPLMKDSMLDLLAGQYVHDIRRNQDDGQRGLRWSGRRDPYGRRIMVPVVDRERMGRRGMLIREHHLTESAARQSQRRRLMYLEATAELNAGRHMGLYKGPIIERHLAYLDKPVRPVRTPHLTETQTLVYDTDFLTPGVKPGRFRVVEATADGRPIMTMDRAGPRIASMHARGVGPRGDDAHVRSLVNQEFGFDDTAMDLTDPDVLDGRFDRMEQILGAIWMDQINRRQRYQVEERDDRIDGLTPNEKTRMYLAARGMEQILNENVRRATATNKHKRKLSHEGKPIQAGRHLPQNTRDTRINTDPGVFGQGVPREVDADGVVVTPGTGDTVQNFDWGDHKKIDSRSLRKTTDKLFDDLGGTRVFQPPSIRETDETLSTHTATRRAIMMGGLSEGDTVAIDSDLPAKHRDLADPEKLAERIQLSTAASRYAGDHIIETTASPDEPSPHLPKEITDFITPAMRVMDDNPLPESLTVRVSDENDHSVRQVGDIIERDFMSGTVSSHAHSDQHDRREPGEGASFRIEMQAGDKGIHREDDVLLPPGKFEVTSIDDNGDIVLAPISQKTGPQVLKNIEDTLDDLPAPAGREEEHQRDLLYNALRQGQVQATVEEPEEIRVLYNAPDQMPLASVHREFNELGDRHEQRALTGREKERLKELGRFIRIRSTGDPDLPDPDDPQPDMPRVIHVPSTGDPSATPSDNDWIMVGPNAGFRSARADVDLDENGVHTDSSGIRMVHDRRENGWRHLEIRRNPVRDREGRSLLQQYTGRVDENGEGIFEDLPLVPNGDGTMFQWDGERWRPDLSQVPENMFHWELGLIVVDPDGSHRRYDPITETWSDYPVHVRDRDYVADELHLRDNWRLRHSGFLMRDSRLGDPRPGTSSDHREMVAPLPTDILYHGSPVEFDEFEFGVRLSGAGTARVKNPDSGIGFHFSPFEQTAVGMGDHMKVVHIRMDNPIHVDRLMTVKQIRQRALISELGLDDVYEEAFTEYLRRKPELFDLIRGDESSMERLLYLPRNDNDYYDPGGFIGSFMDELKRVVKWHEYQKEHGRKPFQQSWQDFNDYGYGNPELTGLLTAEQLEDSTLMRFRSGDDPVGGEGVGTRSDEIAREWIKSFGYDGMIIKEAYMGRPQGRDRVQVGTMDSGDPRQSSYVVFDPSQITTADPPERTPAQQAFRQKVLNDLALRVEQGMPITDDTAETGNSMFAPFDVPVTLGGEELFEGGESKPFDKRGDAALTHNLYKNYGEAAWQRDQEKRSVDEIQDEYLQVGGLASRRSDELRTSLGEQQERLTENMRARRRTQDPAELAELAEDFEYLAGIERRDRREFNGNNRAALRSSRGSVDRGARARMQDKADERRAVRIENGVGGATGDIFNPDDTWVEEAIRERIEVYGNSLERREGIEPKLGGGTFGWTLGTRDEKVGLALGEARRSIELLRGTEWAVDYGDQAREVGYVNIPMPAAVRKFIADSTDEEVLDRLRQAVRQYVSDFDPRIRVSAHRRRVAEIFADPDRRIKSTHEKRSAHSQPTERIQLELSWGVPMDAAAEVRPVSGYLDHKEGRELKKEWLRTRKSHRPDFGNAVDPDFLPAYWADNGISPSGPAQQVYGLADKGSIEFVLKADRANDSAVMFGDSVRQGSKRPVGITSTNADDLLAAILYPGPSEGRSSTGLENGLQMENRMHVMSLLNGSLTRSAQNTGDWSGVLDPMVHRKAVMRGTSPAQQTNVSTRYAEALVPGGFDFEDVEHVSMPVGMFDVPEDLAPGDMGRNHQEVVDALTPFNLSDAELDKLFSTYGSSRAYPYAIYMRNYLGMLEKRRELRKLGLETVFPNHDSIDYFDPQTWLSLPSTAWGENKPSPNSNVYQLLQHLVRADIIRHRHALVKDVRRPAYVHDPTVSVV